MIGLISGVLALPLHLSMPMISNEAALLKKYDVPVPRYTSYPTVPCWDSEAFSSEQYVEAVRRSFGESNDSKGISLYVHLPFCESLCTYCACNTRITRNHKVEERYIELLLKEWRAYLNIFPARPLVRELHLGGGTPTFFSAENLRHLVSSLLKGVSVHPESEFSFEGHPNNTTVDHLQALRDLGFSRVSFGVQDLDEKVQRTINRIQPFENLEKATALSRVMGYRSVSFDLIYGLPHQTLSSIESTINRVLTLRPDRISFYSYAHVPWLRPGQRGYGEAELPSGVEKRALYDAGRKILCDNDYRDIGMDHFALSHDSIWSAWLNGRLHRNFMGYTTTETDLLIGLGASAISDAKYAYAQNPKKVEDYAMAIGSNGMPVAKGHILTREDQRLRKCILDVACRGQIHSEDLLLLQNDEVIDRLYALHADGILRSNMDGFQVSSLGRAFIRNICSAFDLRLERQHLPAILRFSSAI